MYSNIEDAWKTSNDLDKFKNAYKPPVEIKNATNELVSSSESSEKISTPSPAVFKKEVQDLRKLVKLDDGAQCDRLFGHFQTCQECKNKVMNKLNIKSNAGLITVSPKDFNTATMGVLNTQGKTNVDSYPLLRLTENFIDISKYTDILKNKRYSNIISIILFGLLIIIILSMLNNK
jgi:hypothetical protein